MTGSLSDLDRAATAGQVTIQDVARAAGVGRQTVSNVLNGSGRVGEAARARVLEAVASLGYHPHQGARSLRSRRTGQVAYVMPHALLLPSNYIMQRFLQALAAASGSQSYNLMVVAPESDPRAEMRRLIASRTVDAFLLSDLQAADPRVALLAETGTPFACFGRTGPGFPQHWVDIDNRAAIGLAVDHLLSRGVTRISFVGYGADSHWDHERAAGFRAAIARYGLPAAQAGVLLVSETNAEPKIRALLAGARRGAGARPDAIVTGSDRLAAITYGVAAELNLRIGSDLAVTGFDGSFAADLLRPTLTSIVIPIDDIAMRMVAMSLRQVSDRSNGSQGEVVPAALRLGESTGGSEVTTGSPGTATTPGAWPARRAGMPPATGPKRPGQSGHPGQLTAATSTVAVVVAHLTRPAAVARVARALAVLAGQGHEAIVCNVETASDRDRQLAALVSEHRSAGVLAISLPLSRAELARFAAAGTALVSVDAAAAGFPQIVIDNVAGGRLAASHLIQLGHRRIGFIADSPAPPPAGLGLTAASDRMRGYQQALAGAGIGLDQALIRLGPHDPAAAAQQATELLTASSPPSAIFAASDTQATGVLAAARQLGLAVPGELSVIGFDDIDAAAILGLSTIRQPLERSGEEGALRLAALLRGERPAPLRQKLPLELMARASTGSPGTGSPGTGSPGRG